MILGDINIQSTADVCVHCVLCSHNNASWIALYYIVHCNYPLPYLHLARKLGTTQYAGERGLPIYE